MFNFKYYIIMEAKKKNVTVATIVLTSFIILLFFGACSSNEYIPNEEKKIETNDAYTSLSRKLDLYNQSYLMVNSCPQTRGWWSKWNWFNNRGKYIISCDALGARIGSRWGGWGFLGGAVGASLIAALCNREYQIETFDEKFTCELQDNTIAVAPADDNISNHQTFILDSVGYYHNEIILSIERRNPDIYNQKLNTDEVMSIVSGEMKALNFSMPDEAIIKEVFYETSTLVPNKDVFLSEETFVAHIESVKPEYVQDYKIISDYLTTTQMIAKENIQEYTEGVVKVVQESELCKEEKQALVGSILVGGNSALLWAEADLEVSAEK